MTAPSEIAFATARADLLDVAFRIDLAITDIAAAYLAEDAWRIVFLRDEVIGPLSVNQRLKILDQIMEREGWHEDLPFVKPVVHRVFEIRNQLAHSMRHTDPARQGDEWIFPRFSFKRGEARSFDVPLGRLKGLVRLAGVVARIDLQLLWVRSMPEWYWLEGVTDDPPLPADVGAERP